MRRFVPRRARAGLWRVWDDGATRGRWPAPLWQLRREAWLEIGGERLRFVGTTSLHYLRWAHAVHDGVWEPNLAHYLLRTVRSGDVVVDVGAYVGAYTLLASRLVGDRGRVIAVEPDPVARRLLETNIRANDASNVTLVAVGIADYVGTGSLNGTGDSTSTVTAADGGVSVVTLDELCDGISPDVVKMDIEGGETAALRQCACARALRSTRSLAVEIHAGVRMEDIEVAGMAQSSEVIEARDGSRDGANSVIALTFAPSARVG